MTRREGEKRDRGEEGAEDGAEETKEARGGPPSFSGAWKEGEAELTPTLRPGDQGEDIGKGTGEGMRGGRRGRGGGGRE